MYFDEPGKRNTEKTIEIALEAADERKITHVVVASTTGETGLLAAQKAAGGDVKIIVVTHNTGFHNAGVQEMEPGMKKKIESLGGTVCTGTMVLRGLGTAIRQKCGNYSEEQLIADTLRIFGQGMKVCVEMAAMAADAGLVPTGDIICVAGTGRGADTCAILGADSSNRFFNIKVREILAKPSKF